MFELLKASPYGEGKVVLNMCPGPRVSYTNWDLGIPHEISFISDNGEEHLLFSCYISLTHNYFIIEDLDYHNDMKPRVSESLVYYFLDKVVENSFVWATDYKRLSVVIESSLPHITEHFVEHKFSVRTKDLMGADKGYRGFKTLNK